MKIQVVKDTPRYKRGHRRPKMPFNLRTQPWQIQPFCIFPVIPGETMRKLSHLSRTVSDPVKHRLMGMHIQHSYFYVKHTDLDAAAALVEMHLSGTDPALNDTADPKFFHANGINFVKRCLDVIVRWHFRDDFDEASVREIDGVPIAKINNIGWWQSARLNNEQLNYDSRLVGDVSTLPPALQPYSAAYDQWLAMVDAGVTEKTFEDYLAAFGVRVAKAVAIDEEEGRPEHLRTVQTWTYPTNTVEPTTGTPSSAVIWSSEHDASKDRFFKEPGFIVGVQLVRPKVHMAAIKGTMTSLLKTATSWLPATLWDAPFTTVEAYNANAATAFLPDFDDYVWYDLKDLFLYGEEFRNHDAFVPGASVPRKEGDAIQTDYATEADAIALFVDAAKKYLWTEGIVTADIASAVMKDTTP